MLTNLLCSIVVTLVTNTTERLPVTYESERCPDGMLGCLVDHRKPVPVPNPKEKWIVTTIKRITKITVTLEGNPEEFTKEQVVSVTEKHLVLNQEWRELP